LISHVYNYCISNPNQTKSTPIIHLKGPGNKNTEGAHIVGGELYNKLKNYLKVYLEEICQVRIDKLRETNNNN